MTKLLEQAIRDVATVPEARQDEVAAQILEEIARAKLLTGLEEGERAYREGQVVSHEEARHRMERWLK